jgi:4-hydroxyproline epimerase
MSGMIPIDVVDSHTEGEPTRVVIDGWPMPLGRTMVERREYMRREQEGLRRAVVTEPRGHEAIVGALLTPPERPTAAAGIVFFDDVGYLGMCGHGTIGVVRTLEYLGRIRPGHVELDTPVGPVAADLDADGTVTIRNVPARLARRDVAVTVPGIGVVTGDIAWGGNWFFLTELPGVALDLAHRAELLRITTMIREALAAGGITGDDGERIEHVELFTAPTRPDADSRNFVLCPGAAYDRSPCGTGTSAKMATLHGKGELAIGEHWHQESIVGSMFTGWLEDEHGALIPRVRGRAYITGRTTLLFDPDDPFREGLPSR